MTSVRREGSKRFKTKSEAKQFERWVSAIEHNKEWVDRPADNRTLSELWWRYHGQTLKSGVNAITRLRKLDAALGYPQARQINRLLFAEYRAQRLQAGCQPSMLNWEQDRLSGVFSVLIALGHYHNEHPLKGLKKVKQEDRAMGYLTHEEIGRLLAELTGDNLKVVKLCLATDARWSEATGLRRDNVTASRAGGKCAAPYVRFSLHDGGWKYPCAAKNSWSSEHSSDDDVCPLCSGLSE